LNKKYNMKKILFVLAVILLSVKSNAQTLFVRTIDLTIGLKDKDKVEWQEPTTESILIKIDNKFMVIYSAIVQTFRIITFDGENENGVKSWYCSDDKGLNCYLYMSTADPKTGVISIGLEYDDLAYYYRGRQE
jgi:hypothetical protein